MSDAAGSPAPIDATLANEAAGRIPTRPVLLYDDTCRFCRAMAELAMRWDRKERLAFLPWCHAQAAAWLADLDPAVRDRSMHMKLRNGRLLSGPHTFTALLRFLPGLRWLGRLGYRVRPVGWLIERAYLLPARNREPLSNVVPFRPLVFREPDFK